MDQGGTLADLRDVGAYLQGHFLLTTGRHSDTFFLLARLAERPDRLRRWISLLHEQMADIHASAIVGPAVGGIIPAYQLAALRPPCRALFTEKGDGDTMVFRRGFRLDPGESVIIVEDAMTPDLERLRRLGAAHDKLID